FWIARRRRGFIAASGMPDFAATVISRASLENIFDRTASCRPLRCMIFLNCEWPAMATPYRLAAPVTRRRCRWRGTRRLRRPSRAPFFGMPPYNFLAARRPAGERRKPAPSGPERRNGFGKARAETQGRDLLGKPRPVGDLHSHAADRRRPVRRFETALRHFRDEAVERLLLVHS